MDKKAWGYYKKNNIACLWKNAYETWCSTLPWNDKIWVFLNNLPIAYKKFKQKANRLRFKIKKKAIMPTCEYVVTTKCTMNCKHCNTFVPYFSQETHAKPVTFEQFKKDLDILLKAVDYIDYFGFVGGEPLIVKDLDKMIKYACSKKQLKHIFLATNCTIMPSNSLLKAMKNKKFAVQLSDYRDVKFKNDLKVNYLEWKKILSDNKILFSHPQEDGNRNTFCTMPELYPDKQDDEKVKKMFDCCWGQYCNMLCDGILTQCTLSVYITRNLELTNDVKKELVNIRENKSSRQLADEIIKFYAKPYSAFCQYCHMDNIQYGLPCGEQI